MSLNQADFTGRQILQRAAPVGMSSTLLASALTGRVGLILSAGALNRYSVAFGQQAVLNQGITVYPGNQPLVLADRDLGGSLSQDIWAIMETAGESVGVVELLQ